MQASCSLPIITVIVVDHRRDSPGTWVRIPRAFLSTEIFRCSLEFYYIGIYNRMYSSLYDVLVQRAKVHLHPASIVQANVVESLL